MILLPPLVFLCAEITGVCTSTTPGFWGAGDQAHGPVYTKPAPYKLSYIPRLNRFSMPDWGLGCKGQRVMGSPAGATWPMGSKELCYGHAAGWAASVRDGLPEEGLEGSPGMALATLWLVLRLVLSCCVPTLILGIRTRTYRLRSASCHGRGCGIKDDSGTQRIPRRAGSSLQFFTL